MAKGLGFQQEVLAEAAEAFAGMKFSTLDIADRIRSAYPDEWARVVETYGEGGKGAGRHFTVVSSVSQGLKTLSSRGLLYQREYEPAPANHGSSVIRYWSTTQGPLDYFYPDEPHPDEPFLEGSVLKVTVNRYERSVKAREACIAHYKAKCFPCGVDLGERYGERGKGLIHVHHLKPISEVGSEYEVDPIKDLRPVCPNCHAVIHRGEPMLSIEELRCILQP